MVSKIEEFSLSIDGKQVSGLKAGAANGNGGDKPVILALHGGTYTSRYFHVPGYSLLERASAQGFDIIAVDRPGYGGSTALPDAPDLIQKNAEYLVSIVPSLLEHIGRKGAKVFIIGHSIGGAITISMAALDPTWDLRGIAVSGVGVKTPEESAAAYAQFPKTYFVELPTPMKDQLMFGPAETLNPGMPADSHVANTHCPLNELLDITGGWQQRSKSQTANVKVPVHAYQGRYETLWLLSEELVDEFAGMFTSAGRVDTGIIENSGHCIDFHSCAGEFQDSQLSFAVQVS